MQASVSSRVERLYQGSCTNEMQFSLSNCCQSAAVLYSDNVSRYTSPNGWHQHKTVGFRLRLRY